MMDPADVLPELGKRNWLAQWWAPWALAGILLAVGVAVWEPLPPGIWNDDGVYVLLGRSLAQGHGLRYMGIPGAPLAPKFPALFSLLLGSIWLVFPRFPENVPFLGGVNLVLMALAGGVFATYLRRVLKLSPSVALLATAGIWLSPHLWRVALVPLSEPLFILTLILALWAGGRAESKKGVGPVLLFLLAGGCALHTRTLGLAILAAGVLTFLIHHRWRAAFWTGIGTLALFLPWIWWTEWAAVTIPDPLLDTLGPYGPWLMAQIVGHPGEFAHFLFANVGQLLARVLTLLLPGLSAPPLLLALAALPVLGLGAWELFRRSPILPSALGLSLLLLLIWPFQNIRLLVPFQPFLMLAMGMGFWKLANLWGSPAGLRIPVVVIASGWVVFFGVTSIQRLSDGWATEFYRIRSAALMDAVRAVSEKTPADAVVGAPEMWAGLHLYTGRSVIPSARFRPLSGGGPVEGTPEEQYELWIEMGVTHILVEDGGRVHGAALDRIDAVCPPGTVQLLDNQPGRFLVALAWDEACQRLVMEGGPGAGAPEG